MKSLVQIKCTLLLLFVVVQGCWAENIIERFQEGVHYKVVTSSDEVVSSSKGAAASDSVSVVEFFSYGCPHCFSLEPVMEAWKKKIPSYVDFSMMPASWSPAFELLSKAFYTAQVLKIEDKIHKSLFEAIHLQRRQFRTEGALSDFFGDAGVEKETFDKTFNSFAVKQQVKRANASFKQFGLTGVPSVIVGGKYNTDVRMAGSHEDLTEVINFLVNKVRKSNRAKKG